MTITTITRNTGGAGTWGDGKWSPSLPGAGTKALLDKGGTITVLNNGSLYSTSGLEVNSGGATLLINGGLTVGGSRLAADNYRFDVISGSVIVDSGSLTVGQYVTGASGAVEVKNGGSYLWQGSGSTQTVDLSTGANNNFVFTTAFGGAIKGFDWGESITYSGATNSITIGTNQLTFNTTSGVFTINLSTPGITYNSSNLTIVGNSVYTSVSQQDTLNPPQAPGAVVTGISSTTANGSYKAGAVIAITVTFDKVVTVTGAPTLTLETGATDRAAVFASGSGTRARTHNQ